MVKEVYLNDGEEFIYLDERNSTRIRRKSGTGKVLEHLLKNHGKEVSLKEIKRVSRWKNPESTMYRYLEALVNNKSPYTLTKMTKGKNVYYKISGNRQEPKKHEFEFI